MPNPAVSSRVRHLAGWLPAIILPLAATDQLVHACIDPDVSGISVTAWILFLIANVGGLVFAAQEDAVSRLQILLAFGLTAIIDVAIVVVVLVRG